MSHEQHGSSVVRMAKDDFLREVASGDSRFHRDRTSRARGPRIEEMTLQWCGEYCDPKETKPYRIANGDKSVMTTKEQKLFQRTPYERGYLEYTYEGQVRITKSLDDPKDPRCGVREGKGVLKYAGGEAYEGAWKHGKRHGTGFFSTPVGYSYDGEWADDDLEGKGHEIFPCKSSYQGEFANGLPEGKGVLLYAPKVSTYRYEGEFYQGHRHGKGTIFYENGDSFSGTWDFGRRDGHGVTTTKVHGRETQYETEWEQDVMISPPQVIEKNRRTNKPKATLGFSTQSNLVPADLTKWVVKEDVTELPMEHFMRIKMGFEQYDENGTGSLSTAELTAVWGDGSQQMLMKLDADGNGTVELDEIFAAWYPNVPQYNIQRFMVQDINPKVLLRVRGCLGGVVDDSDVGYMQVVGVRSLDSEEDKPLLQKHLDAMGWKIGHERFTVAMYESAKMLCDPPHFLEILEVWYPNIPQATLRRYEAVEIPAEELDEIRSIFFKLSKNEMELDIHEFEEAQDKWRDDGERVTPIEQHMAQGFFKGQPYWRLGTVNLSVQLLLDIDKFDSKIGGSVSLQQLLRFCFPNVRCMRTQEILAGKRKPSSKTCKCQICSVYAP